MESAPIPMKPREGHPHGGEQRDVVSRIMVKAEAKVERAWKMLIRLLSAHNNVPRDRMHLYNARHLEGYSLFQKSGH